jgi:D-serine deaminase-like pyridoxal phosphate-dependent protein
MPTLDWIGKAAVVNHHRKVPYHPLRCDRELSVGDVLYGIPWHICPTVAVHARAIVITEGRASAAWPVDARDRK